MKNQLSLLLILFLIICVQAQDEKSFEKFAKKNKDILSLNAIVADKTYYSQAILEYQLVKRIVDKNGINDTLLVRDKIRKTNDFRVRTSLFIRIDPEKFDRFTIKPCQYWIPVKIEDLKSGFQFRHYLFKGSNKTALQAFGIINSEFNKEDLYVVVDYIQYEDCECSDLPKIRYAVGIRSEFRISGMNLNKGKDSKANTLNIEKLAANVEFDKLKVDISMKTIGITGKLARLNIPNNTSFNVQAYGEYVKTIDFIRNNIDNGTVTIQPEIIPVMDEYRTSNSDINTSSFDEILEIRKRYENYKKKQSKFTDSITVKMDKILENSLREEIEDKDLKRQQLGDIEKYLKNLEKYQKFLEIISPEVKNDTKNIVTNPNNETVTYKSLRKDYNDAISLIPTDKKSAETKLKVIYDLKDDYGNVYEILNLLKSESDVKKIASNILVNYRWLLSLDTIEKLKQNK